MWPGSAFLVGEHGPETFVPRVPGTIIPSAGGVTVNVGGVNVSAANLEAAADLAAEKVRDSVLNSGGYASSIGRGLRRRLGY